jgi:hypothetical protein
MTTNIPEVVRVAIENGYDGTWDTSACTCPKVTSYRGAKYPTEQPTNHDIDCPKFQDISFGYDNSIGGVSEDNLY